MKKRILSIVLTICMVLAFMPQTAFAETYGDFEYSVSDDKVTITKYNGSGDVVEIPSKLGNDYPVTAIGDDAFSNKTTITSVTIPGSVTTIGALAFSNCKSLTNVTIPNSVTTIGEGAFYGCEGLTSITIPNSVTTIGVNAFSNCKSLTNVTIPNSVITIGEGTFYGCEGLTSITIPNSVTTIGAAAFSNCKSLTNVTIPNSVTTIGAYAFDACRSLTSITIPNSVAFIGQYAFKSTPWLRVKQDENPLVVINGILIDGSTTTGTVSITNDITSIGDCAFYGSGITSITIPDSVTYIGTYAFYNCSSLTSITIPNSVTSIGYATFQGCTGLTNVTIPDSVSSIGEYAFYSCSSLTNVTIPNGVTSIRNRAFYNCISLTSITIPNSVTSIGEFAFRYCKLLTSITIPNSVTSIGKSAFRDCTGLESIFLPDGLDVSSANIRGEATQVKYSLDAEGKVTITGITGETSVSIPAEICGYPVVAVADNYQGLVGTHTCVGGQATCQSKAACGICGKEYGEIDSTNHNIENIPAKDATVTEAGNKEYWHCKDCGKNFSDENGNNIIELKDITIAKLPPEIINGKGMSITAGETKELTFRSNADFSDFIRVELDGKTLDAKYYTAKEGSTIITLKADYVASLPAGDHTIGIVSTSGTATTEFTVNAQAASDKDSPKTGDNSNLLLWLALLFVSGGMMTATGGYRKRENHS